MKKANGKASAAKRLDQALKVIGNLRIRLAACRIYKNEPDASIFWDEDEHQIEFVADEWEIVIREREPHD